MKTLQDEHRAWAKAMYPDTPAWVAAMGAFEECGEMAQCIVKLENERLHGKEPRHEGVDWSARLVDAIGDCAIYVDTLCMIERIDDWHALLPNEHLHGCHMLDFAKLARALSTMLERALIGNFVDRTLVTFALKHLELVARKHGISLRWAIERTWAVVKERKR